MAEGPGPYLPAHQAHNSPGCPSLLEDGLWSPRGTRASAASSVTKVCSASWWANRAAAAAPAQAPRAGQSPSLWGLLPCEGDLSQGVCRGWSTTEGLPSGSRTLPARCCPVWGRQGLGPRALTSAAHAMTQADGLSSCMSPTSVSPLSSGQQ